MSGEIVGVTLILGDCLERLRETLGFLPDNSIDALVTDPPAGIGFMGKDWDHDKGGRDAWVDWLASVLRECHRVMKPGAHGLVWALPRTSHWTGMACELAGFEVRDRVSHLFGTGFPKSLDVSKAIDKAAGAEREVTGTQKLTGTARIKTTIGARTSGAHDGYAESEIRDSIPRKDKPATAAAAAWKGFGTALKPACEDWWLIRKPCSEKTVAANVLKWGTGALNIDGCRVEFLNDKDKSKFNADSAGINRQKSTKAMFDNSKILGRHNLEDARQGGRFPANLVLSHSPYCTDSQCDVECAVERLDAQSGTIPKGDSGGASRFFYCAKISPSERNAGLEGMPDVECGIGDDRPSGQSGSRLDGRPPRVAKNHHPTVKSTKLMRYLCRLITPPGGLVLDPFMGSGSTGVAAVSEGFGFVGIERDAEYFEIARARIDNANPAVVVTQECLTAEKTSSIGSSDNS